MIRRLALATAGVLVAPLLVVTSQAAGPAYQVRALTVTARVASMGALGVTKCVVDADLYTPRGVSRSRPAPAILMTHGFGGSKADNASFARAYASRGYVVLSYSGLGQGSGPDKGRRGSDCKITFDDRDHDGAAGRALVDFLGGARKADDGSRVDFVVRDPVAHDGRRYTHDPRVGMIGGSYGGAAQFAVAAVDPRVDTIVPMITWNDLAFSLSPNSTSLAPGTVRYRVPGVEKVYWSAAFLAQGSTYGGMGVSSANGKVGVCPNFYDPFCHAFTSLTALGYADATSVGVLRNASVTSFADRIRVPVMLMQGQADTLFPLREAVATYQALRANRTPVKMVWHSWGHSATPRRGEFSWGSPDTNHQGRMVRDWFAHFLKDLGPRPRMDFSWFRDWAYRGDAASAYASAPRYPLPGTTTLHASGRSLFPRNQHLTTSHQYMTTAGTVPTSVSELPPKANVSLVHDSQGSSASFTTAPLRRDVDVVGAPTARLRLSSPTAHAGRPEAMLVAFVKLYDVAPDGTVTLPHGVVAAIRVGDLRKRIDVALPALVHRFRKGHRLRLVVSLSDAAYRGNNQVQTALLSTSPSVATTLTLPGRISPKAFG